MAKKVETVSLIDTFSEFKELKNIDRTTMVSVLEESFRSVIAKMFGTDENYDVIVNPDKGDFEIWRNREVVADEDLENPNLQIALSEAQKIDASYEVGEEVTDEVIFANFGRRAILNLRQTLASKILELEKDSIYNKYIDKYMPFDIYKEKMVISEELVYESKEDYLNGVSLKVGNNYNFYSLCGGIVVYIGNKEGLGNTVIIQGNDGIDYWYSNLDNLSVNLYDYIESNVLLGVSKNEYVYLTFLKNGEYIDYEKFI